MSSTRNTDALANNAGDGSSGQFQARIPRDEPMMTSGHKPGVNVGNDAVPEFNAQTLPAGSAPASRTFQPNNVPDIPPVSNYAPSKNLDPESTTTSATDFPGATSGDVHTGLGKPIQGQTSSELRHDGERTRNNPGSGLEGRKAVGQGTVDPHNPERMGQRALDNDEAVVGRGNVGGPAAEERIPEGSETVARERN